MKYKIGDRVRIKSINWYNKNKDDYGSIYAGNGFCFWKNMARHCGEIMIISSIKVDPEDSNKGYYFMENSEERWTDEMIEGLVEEETQPKFKVGDRVKWYNHTCDITSIDTSENTYKYLISNFDYGEDKVFAKWIPESELTFDGDEETKTNIIEEAKTYWDSIKDAWVCPEGYIFKDENGNVINAMKIVLEKKKKKYPKTYGECAEIIAELTGSDCNPKGCMGYMSVQLTALQKLLICRDAYWKIAGEEMGLGKPWEPDWKNSEMKYTISFEEDEYTPYRTFSVNCPVAFPTEEMRDAFYENFKELIGPVKELL